MVVSKKKILSNKKILKENNIIKPNSKISTRIKKYGDYDFDVGLWFGKCSSTFHI